MKRQFVRDQQGRFYLVHRETKKPIPIHMVRLYCWKCGRKSLASLWVNDKCPNEKCDGRYPKDGMVEDWKE